MREREVLYLLYKCDDGIEQTNIIRKGGNINSLINIYYECVVLKCMFEWESIQVDFILQW